MMSIRRSLILCFLTLLAVALGSVSGIACWTAADALEARKYATGELLKEQHERRCNRERRNFDNALLIHARTIASLAQFQVQAKRQYIPDLEPLGILTASLAPEAHLHVPLWLAQSSQGPLAYRIFRLATTEIQIAPEDLPLFGDDKVADSPISKYLSLPHYIQISTIWGTTWQSASMEQGELAFPDHPEDFADLPLFESRFDYCELDPGVKVRRVVLRAPVVRFRQIGGPVSRTPPRPASETREPTSLLIQAAADPTVRNRELEKLETEYEAALAQLETESAATLHGLRWQVAGIAFLTFVLTLGGGFALVRLGLAPLQRLSEAVSRISEKDFRLQLGEGQLPQELLPIAERLSQTLDQLHRAFTREKQATADISHELRTPLAALLTTTEFGLRKQRSADEYRQLLGDCRTIAQQLTQQVERLLTLARLDAGVDRLRPQSIEVTAVAEQCAGLVRPLAEARSLTLQVHHRGPVSLTTDPDKLREVLTNLLHNAIEYNRPAGRVDLTVERVNGRLDIEVRDSGIGIAPEAQASIFQRFFRADSSRHDAGLHAGLGLAIVKGYVDLMGGRIHLESVPGEGTSIRVSLPVRDG
jgi:signal transduction histidine kinase